MNIGDTWNEWTVVKFIGEGSFGKVYKIKREEFGCTYYSALKVLRIPQSKAEVTVARHEGMSEESVTTYFQSMLEDIVSEVALMSKLRGDSNIVSLEDHKVEKLENDFGWEVYIRMEFLTPLFDYLRNNTLTVRDVIKMGIDMCKALEICQKHNIIHRDIKPENIFLSDQGNYKLGDFGIARQFERTSTGLSKRGTESYMAPEVYRGQSSCRPTVDIYSLGIVLYRFLNNNRTPFLPPYPEQIHYSDKERAKYMRMNGEKMVVPCNAEGRLAEIVMKACAYEPKDRYENAYEMRRALESIAHTQEESRIVFPPDDSLDRMDHSTKETAKPAEERARKAAEERARREAEEKARREAEERARRAAKEKARREAEEKASREAEERARRAAKEKARREAEEKASREVEERAREVAEEMARRKAEEKTRREATERAKRENANIQRKTYANGDVYEGELKNGRRDGFGKMTYRTGDTEVYEGEWKNDKRNGQGTCHLRYGSVYEGGFANDKYYGQGKMTYEMGDVFEGQFVNGKRNGWGRMTHANGQIIEGIWEDGIFVGSQAEYIDNQYKNNIYKIDANEEVTQTINSFMEKNDTITLEYDNGEEEECGIIGVFDVDGKDYIALNPLGTEDVYIYGYRELEEDFELIDITSNTEMDKAIKEFERLINA